MTVDKHQTILPRIFWLDVIRVISIFLVIVIHTSAYIVIDWGNVSTTRWMIANIYDSVSRVSVPLFIMISGSLILDKHDDLINFFIKRLSRIILPWIFWGTILLFFNQYFGIINIANKNPISVLLENYFGGFWFMPMLLGLYVITPIIKLFVNNAKKIDFIYFFSLWFFIVAIIPTLNRDFGVSINLSTPIWINYLGYYIGGYYMVKKIPKKIHLAHYAKIIYSISLVITILGTFLQTLNNNSFVDSFYNYVSIPTILMSFSIFEILKNYFKNIRVSIKTEKLINFLALQSFGVFLSHFMILKLFEYGYFGYKLSASSFNPILSIPIISIVVLFFCSLIIFMIKKIPLIKNFVG